MRTTLSISDELLEAAKRRARETGQSLGAVVDAARDAGLARKVAMLAPVICIKG